MRKLLPPVVFLACVPFMALLDAVAPIYRYWSGSIRLLGLVPFAIGLVLSGAVRLNFVRRSATINTFDRPNQLVREGVFRYTRNPMYLGLVLSLIGVALLFGSLAPLLVALSFAVLVDRWYIRYEERRMAEAFGESYARYKAATRRWI